MKIYVPQDSAAKAMGADAVAAAIQTYAAEHHLDLTLVRNGSRGMLWLEPLVEIETPQGRVGYGNVRADQVAALFEGGENLGLVEDLPYLRKQQRLTFARIGITDPLSLDNYQAHGGFAGLRAALQLPAADIVQAISDSGLRGRGGAAFPAGIKWQTVRNAQAAQKYIVCNADEGDSGTFADRMLMEGDPFALIEGMTIAGIAVGATQGFIYVRSEYPQAIFILNQAIALCQQAGFLGDNLQNSGKSFDIVVRKGAGSYVCGEETALLESLEGKRGLVRAKPPLPALSGLFGQPTLIHNVLSLASVPIILAKGAAAYCNFGSGRSRGTLAFQLAGNLQRGGLVELAFGVSLRTLLNDYGGGSASGRPLKAVQVGGPLGAYLPEAQWDTPLDYEAFAAIGATLGHGGIVAHDDTADLAQLARYAFDFCAHESCGKCTPCRIGSVRGVEIMDKLIAKQDVAQNTALLHELCDVMTHGSLCAMGGMTAYPVLSALNHFPDAFR
jgi:formate dehydrogenase iron-sulfur subunit